jgi:hypothetical protein
MLLQQSTTGGQHRPSQLDDKAVAMLYLLADAQQQHHAVRTRCPSLEKLANFIDRKLSPDDRLVVQAHLQNCPECHFHYQEVYAFLPWYQKTFNYIREQARNLNEKIRNGLPRMFNYLQEQVRNFYELLGKLVDWLFKVLGPVPTVAAVAFSLMLLVGSVVMYRTLFLLSPLEESYMVAFQQPQLVVQKNGASPLAFSQQESSLAAQAFKAGLQVGQQRLLEQRLGVEKIPYDSAFATQYELGQWVALLQVTAPVVMTLPVNFWQQQYLIGEDLRQRLQTNPENNSTALTGLKPILEVLNNLRTQPSQQLGYKLGQPVKNLVLQLSIE